MRQIIFTEDASAKYHEKKQQQLRAEGREATEAEKKALEATENRYDMHNAGVQAGEEFAEGRKIRQMTPEEYKTQYGISARGRRLKKYQKESADFNTNSGQLSKLHGQMIKATNKNDPTAIKKAQENLKNHEKNTGFVMYDFNDRKPGV